MYTHKKFVQKEMTKYEQKTTNQQDWLYTLNYSTQWFELKKVYHKDNASHSGYNSTQNVTERPPPLTDYIASGIASITTSHTVTW